MLFAEDKSLEHPRTLDLKGLQAVASIRSLDYGCCPKSFPRASKQKVAARLIQGLQPPAPVPGSPSAGRSPLTGKLRSSIWPLPHRQ